MHEKKCEPTSRTPCFASRLPGWTWCDVTHVYSIIKTYVGGQRHTNTDDHRVIGRWSVFDDLTGTVYRKRGHAATTLHIFLRLAFPSHGHLLACRVTFRYQPWFRNQIFEVILSLFNGTLWTSSHDILLTRIQNPVLGKSKQPSSCWDTVMTKEKNYVSHYKNIICTSTPSDHSSVLD